MTQIYQGFSILLIPHQKKVSQKFLNEDFTITSFAKTYYKFIDG